MRVSSSDSLTPQTRVGWWRQVPEKKGSGLPQKRPLQKLRGLSCGLWLCQSDNLLFLFQHCSNILPTVLDAILPESERMTLRCFGLRLGAFLTVDRIESYRSTGWKVLKLSALYVLRKTNSYGPAGPAIWLVDWSMSKTKKNILEDFPV